MTSSHDLFPCPSCGFLVFREGPGSYDICPICGWEDDDVQLRYPTMGGGANGPCLAESQRNALLRVPLGTSVHSSYCRDPEWRPLQASELAPDPDEPTDGLSYFHASGEELPPYYWRRK